MVISGRLTDDVYFKWRQVHHTGAAGVNCFGFA
jgi:hypothetical protein